jgi:hypothetical protein
MVMDLWYELLIRELTAGMDAAAELREDAARARAAAETDEPEGVTASVADGAPAP